MSDWPLEAYRTLRLEEIDVRYTGGYTVLRQRIKQLRKQGHRLPVERFETGSGVQAQMDWATYTIDFP